jgi:hypothetical protein
VVQLSDGQLSALRNLGRKQAGQAVDWINISDARSLAELGLAERGREGWDITAAGLSALQFLGLRATEDQSSRTPHEPIPMRDSDHERD